MIGSQFETIYILWKIISNRKKHCLIWGPNSGPPEKKAGTLPLCHWTVDGRLSIRQTMNQYLKPAIPLLSMLKLLTSMTPWGGGGITFLICIFMNMKGHLREVSYIPS